MKRAFAAALLVALFAGPAAGRGDSSRDGDSPDPGQIIFGKGKSLWRQPLEGGAPTEIVKLGFRARDITGLETGKRHRGILVSRGDRHYFARLGDDGRPVAATLACRGRATLAGDGRCVLCESPDGKIELRRMAPSRKALRVEAGGRLATLRGARVDQVVAVTKRGVEAFPVAGHGKPTLLANERPERNLLISPDGKRAVAVFEDAAQSADGGPPIFSIYQFLLDGEGVRRKLIADATAIRWSRDSRWVLSFGKRESCVARARGGQYRCFKGYRAADLAPSGDEVLLLRGGPGATELYRASLGGAHSARPRKIRGGVRGAAALWIPSS